MIEVNMRKRSPSDFHEAPKEIGFININIKSKNLRSTGSSRHFKTTCSITRLFSIFIIDITSQYPIFNLNKMLLSSSTTMSSRVTFHCKIKLRSI